MNKELLLSYNNRDFNKIFLLCIARLICNIYIVCIFFFTKLYEYIMQL